MGDFFEAWMWGGDVYDRRTRRQLDEVAATQSRARSALASQLRRQAGDLQAQIDRLAAAFVALVEYEDVRGELNEHADAAAVRRWARGVIGGAAGGDGVPADGAPPPDVPGYWLHPAAVGIATDLQGRDGAPSLAAAAERDPRRTACALVLLDAVRGHVRWSGLDDLDRVLPDGREVTAAARAAWWAAADGRLGQAACDALEVRLASLAPADPAPVRRWLADLAEGGRGSRHRPGPEPAAQLARLAQLVNAASGDDPVPDGPPVPDDPAGSCLRALVDEGAPGEVEVLARLGEARRQLALVDAADGDDRWDAPVGDLTDLLLADLADADAPPGRRRVAVDALRPALAAAVEELAQEATAIPAHREVAVAGRVIQVGPDGTSEDWQRPLERVLRDRDAVPGWLRPAGLGALVVAAVGLLLAVASPGWLLLAVAAVLTGGLLLIRDRQARAALDGQVDREVARTARAVEHTADMARADRAQAAEARRAAETARSALGDDG